MIALLLIAISGIFGPLQQIKSLTTLVTYIFTVIDWTTLVVGATMTAWFRRDVNVNVSFFNNFFYVLLTYLICYFLTYYILKF